MPWPMFALLVGRAQQFHARGLLVAAVGTLHGARLVMGDKGNISRRALALLRVAAYPGERMIETEDDDA